MATVAAQALIAGIGGKTNFIRNPRGDGAAVGGSLPTFWSCPLLAGLSQDVVGIGTDAATGVPYVDIQFFGTTFADGNLFIYVEPSTYAIAAPGNTFTSTAYLGMPDGDLTNIGQITYNTTISTGNITFTTTPSARALTRYSGSGTVGAGGTTVGLCYFQLFVLTGDVNITLRLGGFQLERGLVRTPLILPPVGAPGATVRALLAMPAAVTPAQATINGLGGVRATGPAVQAAQARIDGRGTVGAAGAVPGQAYAAALIAGDGKITPHLRANVPANHMVPGEGFVRATPTGRSPVPTTRLGGVGRVQATAFAMRPAAAKIAGLGGRSANTVVLRNAGATIGGLGTLRASGTAGVKGAAARIAGQGGVSGRVYNPLAVIHGQGSVAASALVLARPQARITGTGNFRATVAPLAWARARIDGTGYVEADIDSTHHVTLTVLAGVGRVMADARIFRGAAATLRGAGGLRADGTQIHQTYQVSATIHGAGGVLAAGTFRGAYHTTAQIDGRGAVRASNAPNKVTQQAAATIHGVGHVGGPAPGEIEHAAARISGVGRVIAVSVVRLAVQATATIRGLGAVRALGLIPGPPQPASAAIHGAGLVHASARAILHAAAQIHGAGGFRAFTRTSYPVSAQIHGTGGVRASNAPNKVTQPASARIDGTGALRASTRAVHAAHATLTGVGAMLAPSRVLRAARALIGGLGSLRGDAKKAAFPVHAAIHGVGGVHAPGRLRTSGGARINGRGSVTTHPGVLFPAAARIAGAGRVRLRTSGIVGVRAQIRGVGGVIADPDLKAVHHAVVRIAGQGGVKPDPFIPRDRVALYGVHLPATKRSAMV